MASNHSSNDPFPTLKYFKCSRPCPETPTVVHVEINRPEKLNAFIEPMWRELGVLFKHLSSSPSVGAIVLSGASPKAFTTGIDVSEFASSPLLNPLNSASSSTPDPSRTSHQIREHVTAFQASISAVAECAKPVVAAVHGHCLGLGVDLICCADVRVASSDAVFAVKEVDIGIAADIGTLTRLPKIVRGGSWVMDVCLSGRTFRAEEAKDVGFVSRVVKINGNGNGSEDVVRDVLRWAEDVAQKSPVAVAGTKEILKWSWDRSVADGLRYTAVWNSAMLQTPDVQEAAMARMQKRKPRFSKL